MSLAKRKFLRTDQERLHLCSSLILIEEPLSDFPTLSWSMLSERCAK